MKKTMGKKGFTLIEMLVAMAIVVSIVSMVYGSYFATSRSAEAYKAKMSVSESTGELLRQMARQIRCCYAKAPEPAEAGARQSLPKTQGILEEPVGYFQGGDNLRTGEVLRFVTTARVYSKSDLNEGLIDVVYVFDKITRTLMVSTRRFVETASPLPEEPGFSAVMEGVENIETAFFDGTEWRAEWDYLQTKRLPAAVRIRIAVTDENGRTSEYATVAQTNCLRKWNNTKNNNLGR